jgi:N-acyl homoserine lactone hydrolase
VQVRSRVMRVHCFSTGVLRPKARARGVRRYLDRRWSDATLPVNVVAVEHPEGVCLFDAGQEARAAEPGFLPRWHPWLRVARFELGPADEAAPQLERLGITPGGVHWVVLSHLHTDHIGGLAPFAAADVLVLRAEWTRAQGLGGRLRGYVPQQWPSGLVPRVIDLDGPPVGPFPSSLDLAGAGTLLIVPTPGHTPGHVSLLVRDGPRGLLCAGDLAHSPAELDRVAPAVADYCRRDGIVVLATHDPEAPSLVTGWG